VAASDRHAGDRHAFSQHFRIRTPKSAMALCWPFTVGASTIQSAQLPTSLVFAGAVKVTEVLAPVVTLLK
jgi:hypothetical protein